MAQLFSRSANTIAKASIYGGAVVAAALGWLVVEAIPRSSYATGKTVVYKQPVPFSHDHHTAGLGIDCRYCHTSVEESAFAGIPPVSTCMNCHKNIWTNAELLEPIRESYRTGVPVQWRRINDLPDFVYFNHSIHVAKGVSCYTCHGPINEMPLVYQHATLQMEWCLSCHRNPEQFVRPRDQVFNWDYEPEGSQEAVGAKLVQEYQIQKLENCSTCHR
ncbi:MAG TPA: cytochrome c3 family protein [Thermoanaerobaculia bacterium]|nr:cytochrome c3 family protein [Thermoanaerobaculia bacterium]